MAVETPQCPLCDNFAVRAVRARSNAAGETTVTVRCAQCSHEFTVRGPTRVIADDVEES